MSKRYQKKLRSTVMSVLNRELASILHDISYRLGVLYEAQVGGRVGSRDLNLAQHIIDGYTVTDNNPAGGITWADLHITYKGITYNITGGSTTMKYAWFDFSANPNTTLVCQNEKPTLAEEDVLVFTNNSGVHQTVMNSGRMMSGLALIDGTVGSGEIGNLAISAEKLANGAVSELKMADGAVSSLKLASGAVTSTKLYDGAVTTAKIGAGAVAADKLNTAQHFLY